jgi:tRNA pseudouridine13 synthase
MVGDKNIMKIKEFVEDFLVDEISNIKPKKEGEYTYFQLKKNNYTTQRAIHQVSRNLRIARSRIGFAGNKDKFAITTQVCSAWKIEPEELDHINLKDLKIKALGKGDERINLGDLEGNKFKIIIRDVSEQELANFKKNFTIIKKKGFLNLFGEQRFGSAGNSDKIGNAIINGNLEEAAKLFITEHGNNVVAQEFGDFAKKNWGQWVDIINKCPKFLGLEKAVLNWLIRVPTDFGGALRQVPKPTRRIFISAYQSRIWNKKVEELAKQNKLEAELKIPPIDIKRMPELTMLGTERQTCIIPKKLKQKTKKDLVELEFELSKGCYATVLIDTLFNS